MTHYVAYGKIRDPNFGCFAGTEKECRDWITKEWRKGDYFVMCEQTGRCVDKITK